MLAVKILLYIKTGIKLCTCLTFLVGVGASSRGVARLRRIYRAFLGRSFTLELVADSYSIVASWRKYFFQLFNVHGVKDVGQAEIHTAEPLVPEPSASEV